MSSLVTPSRFDQVVILPIALPETELRRGKFLYVSVLDLPLGQVAEIRSLTLHVVKVLTPGVVPQYNNTAMGMASVGLYTSKMITGGIAAVRCLSAGVSALNPAMPTRVTSPGVYRIIVSNNCANVDISVTATGSIRLLQ